MNTAEQQQSPPQDGNVLGAAAVPVQGAPQLPPQMFTTAAQLLDLTDSRFSFFFSSFSLDVQRVLPSRPTKMFCAKHSLFD